MSDKSKDARDKATSSSGFDKSLVKNFKYVRFIMISTLKLKAKDLTLATATVLFQKYFSRVSRADYDPYLIATTSIYLASKIEEDPIKLRDIINVSYATLHPELEHLQLDDKYQALKNSVLQTELVIVRELSFDLAFEHPHKFLLIYWQSLRQWLGMDLRNMAPIGETAWTVLRDVLHSNLLIKYRPQEVAISIIYFALVCYGVQVPCNDVAKRPWWKALDDRTSRTVIHEIVSSIVSLYEYESQSQDLNNFK